MFHIAGLVGAPMSFTGCQFQPLVQDHYVLQAVSSNVTGVSLPSGDGIEAWLNRGIDQGY
jgi:hypothetical protein